MGSSISKKRDRHLDEVLVWTLFVKKQKWSLSTLPLSIPKGTKVTQKRGKKIYEGRLAKSTSQRSTKFKVNVENGVEFTKFHDIYIGTFKITAEKLIETVSFWYPRLLSQSHLTHKEIYPPPPPRETTIDLQDTTVTSYTAMDLADCKHTRRSKNLRTILKTELENREHNHQTSVTSAHVDSLHHQKKLNAVKKYFGEDRKLFYVSVDELEAVIDHAGIGHLEYTQTIGIEGIPMNKKQRRRQPKLKSKEQISAIQLLLAEIFEVMTLHVHVLDVREGLETVENPPPKKLSLCQRFMRIGKKRVKLRRSEVKYMISTHSGPPSIKLETQQRLLVKIGQEVKENSDSDSSGSDSDSSSSSEDSDDNSGPRRLGSGDFSDFSPISRGNASESDESSDNDNIDGDDEKKGDEKPHIEVTYKDGGIFANKLVDPLGDLVGLLDQDVENPAIIVAHEPVRKVIIPTAGFLSRKAALLDAFGSYLTKKEAMETFERRIARKSTLGMKMNPPSPTRRKKSGRNEKKTGRRDKKKGTKYAAEVVGKKLEFDEDAAEEDEEDEEDEKDEKDEKEVCDINAVPVAKGPEIDE